MKYALLTSAAALLLMTAPGSAQVTGSAPAEEARAGGWAAWYGCWEATFDDTAVTGDLVCVLPGADALSARIAQVEDGEIVDELVIRADGQPVAVSEGGCTGAESAAFSRDGQRLYTTHELDCQGLDRTAAGIFALTAEDEWVEVQSITVGGQSTGRTVQYRAVAAEDVPGSIAAMLPTGQGMALQAARMGAASSLDTDDVIEASAVVGAAATEALLGARRQGFSLDARTLTRLEDADVAPSTIDVMVALSYPSRFAVQQSRGLDGGGAAYMYERDAMRDYCADLYGSSGIRTWSRMALEEICDPNANGIVRNYGYGYGYRDPYRYNYGGYGYDPYRWGYGSGPVVIINPSAPSQPARAVGGTVSRDGYTRGTVSPRGTAAPRSGVRARSPSATSRDARTSGTTTRSAPPPRTSTPTRTAKPRPGGGGGGDSTDGGGV